MSSDSSSPDRLDRIEARLDRLEQRVAELRDLVDASPDVDSDPEPSSGTGAPRSSPAGRSPTSPDDSAADAAPSSAHPTGPPTADPKSDEEDVTSPSQTAAPASSRDGSGLLATSAVRLRSADWLSYVGIGLLLFGLAFLFKYSIEQGWLVPVVRVGFGGLTGSVLLGAGLRIYEDRRRLRQILLGGSSATFYGTVFAAYQLYGLVSYPVAFGSMGAVTVVSIALALHQDHASMAVIGTIGGLGTPFLLYGDVGAVGGFSVYTSLVLTEACAVYLYRGWRTLLYTAVVGGWAVLLVPCADAALSGTRPDGAGTLQGAVVLAWLLLGGVPILRAVLRIRQPDRWPATPQTRVAKWHEMVFGDRPAYGLVTSSPFVALFASRLLWTGSAFLWAGVAAVGVLVYIVAFLGLRRLPMPRYAPAHGLVAAVLSAYALSEALGGATLLVAWAVEALLLLVLARRLDDTTLRVAGHGLFAIVGGWLGSRFSTIEPSPRPLVSPAALSELVVLGLGVVALCWMSGPRLRRLYHGGVLAGWLAWWTHELIPVANGQAYVSLVWGLTATALLAGGAWRRHEAAQQAGLATLALFVGKLFLIDFATLPALWRIALFLGAGGGFLLVSYALPGLGDAGPTDGSS